MSLPLQSSAVPSIHTRTSCSALHADELISAYQPTTPLPHNRVYRQTDSTYSDKRTLVCGFLLAINMAHQDFGDGYLECQVTDPQRQNEGTQNSFVSYLVVTKVGLVFLSAG